MEVWRGRAEPESERGGGVFVFVSCVILWFCVEGREALGLRAVIATGGGAGRGALGWRGREPNTFFGSDGRGTGMGERTTIGAS